MVPVVLLHGFAQTPTSWDAVTRLLQDRGHRTYALDLYRWLDERLSEGAGDISLGALCQHVAGTVRQVANVEGPPVLVGYSMGGRIAAETLVRHSSLPLAGLVLESAGLGSADEAARTALAERNAAWAARLREEGVGPFMDWWETLPLFASQHDLPAETRAAVRAERTSHGVESLAQSLEAWGAQHQATEPETIAALIQAHDQGLPLIYVAGERDGKYAAVAMRLQAAGLPTAVIPGVGHNTHLENPAAFIVTLG